MLVSIFNDVVGPVMRGPSSSHCAAALRIGRIARDLMNSEIDHVLVQFDTGGSLPATHQSQGSDMGLFGGLLGWEADDDRLPDSGEWLKKAGIDLQFEYGDYGDTHPNTYRLTLRNARRQHEVIAISTGGGMFETGAGGSAPKHVQQFNEVGYLRWDSLGEFLALAVSLEHLGNKDANNKALILGRTLDVATERLLLENKSPARKLGQIDNRGSHFYLSLYWANELANQNEDVELKNTFEKLAVSLNKNEQNISDEFISAQGNPVDIDGYYFVDDVLAEKSMRPSATFNKLLSEFKN